MPLKWNKLEPHLLSSRSRKYNIPNQFRNLKSEFFRWHRTAESSCTKKLDEQSCHNRKVSSVNPNWVNLRVQLELFKSVFIKTLISEFWFFHWGFLYASCCERVTYLKSNNLINCGFISASEARRWNFDFMSSLAVTQILSAQLEKLFQKPILKDLTMWFNHPLVWIWPDMFDITLIHCSTDNLPTVWTPYEMMNIFDRHSLNCFK